MLFWRDIFLVSEKLRWQYILHGDKPNTYFVIIGCLSDFSHSDSGFPQTATQLPGSKNKVKAYSEPKNA